MGKSTMASMMAVKIHHPDIQVMNPQAPAPYFLLAGAFSLGPLYMTYHEKFLGNRSVAHRVGSNCPEVASEERQGHDKAEEDNGICNVRSERADEEDQADQTHEQEPETYNK